MSDVQEPLAGGIGENSGAEPEGLTPGDEFSPSRYEHRPPRRRPPSLFWPLVFIAAGVILLLWNLGVLSEVSWGVIWRLWPLLLIAIGIEVLFGRRSTAGSLLSGLLILVLIGIMVVALFFAQDIPILSDLAESGGWQTEHVEYPLGEVDRASVYIDWTSLPGNLSALGDSANLIEGDIAYSGELVFSVDVRGDHADVELDTRSSGAWSVPWGSIPWTDDDWNVQLSPRVLLDLNLDTGSGSCDFDLSGLQIEDLVIDGGSGSIELVLPAGHSFEAHIDGGSGAITIVLPENVGAQVVLDSGSGAFRPDSRFRLVEGERGDDEVWETDNYRTAEHTIVLRIDQGSGAVTIE